MYIARVLWCLVFCLAVSAEVSLAVERPVVLFDQGHGQLFYADRKEPLDLSGLAALFEQGGFTVRTGRGEITATLLDGVDALVISGPFKPFTPAEIDAVRMFLHRGGSLSVMLHIGPPLADLLHSLEVDFSNGVIREQEDVIDGDTLNFRVSHLKPHPLTEGLTGFNLYGGWALMNADDNSEIVAETGPLAWVDLNGDKKLSPRDPVQAFGVAVAGRLGKGRFVVFGDDAIFQNRFLTEANVILAKNLIKWMK